MFCLIIKRILPFIGDLLIGFMTLGLLFWLLSLAGCSLIVDPDSYSLGGLDGGYDGAFDSSLPDSAFRDGEMPLKPDEDSGIDSSIDSGFDAGTDTGFDTSPDTGYDAGFDAGVDAGPTCSPCPCSGSERCIWSARERQNYCSLPCPTNVCPSGQTCFATAIGKQCSTTLCI